MHSASTAAASSVDDAGALLRKCSTDPPRTLPSNPPSALATRPRPKRVPSAGRRLVCAHLKLSGTRTLGGGVMLAGIGPHIATTHDGVPGRGTGVPRTERQAGR